MDRCICCGDVIPEGMHICFACEVMSKRKPKPTLTELADAVCAEYCKYPDEYSSIYCDDEDEAQERCAIEKCENCPMTILRMEADRYDP